MEAPKIYGWPQKFFVKNHLFFLIQTFFSPNKSPYMLYIQVLHVFHDTFHLNSVISPHIRFKFSNFTLV